MRRRSIMPVSEPATAVNATPLIDVVLCMIVFFLIVGKLAATRRTPMDLPRSATGAPEMPPDSFVINIVPSDAGRPPSVVIESETTDLAGITPMLQARLARNPRVTVQIRAPRNAAYSAIEPAIEAAAAAGVRDVRLATDRAAIPGARP